MTDLLWRVAANQGALEAAGRAHLEAQRSRVGGIAESSRKWSRRRSRRRSGVGGVTESSRRRNGVESEA